jgi:hypothetical protein
VPWWRQAIINKVRKEGEERRKGRNRKQRKRDEN